jgi:hypothetical protein
LSKGLCRLEHWYGHAMVPQRLISHRAIQCFELGCFNASSNVSTARSIKTKREVSADVEGRSPRLFFDQIRDPMI